jgi:hypothetical protein
VRFSPAVGLQMSREGGSRGCHRVQRWRLRDRTGGPIDRPRVTRVGDINQAVGVVAGRWL